MNQKRFVNIILVAAIIGLASIGYYALVRKPVVPGQIQQPESTQYHQLIPISILESARTRDASSRPVEMSDDGEEIRYTFVGKEVFQVTIHRSDDQILFNTAYLRPGDFLKYKVLNSWAVDYASAKEIAQNANKSFSGELSKLGSLQDAPLQPAYGGIEPPPGIISRPRPYWTFVANKPPKGYAIYIDAINGGIILTKEFYLR